MNSSIITVSYLIWVVCFFLCRINAKSRSKLLMGKTLKLKSPVLASFLVKVNDEDQESYKITLLGVILYILWALFFVFITVVTFIIPQTQIASSVITFSDSPLYFNTINDRLILYLTPAFACIILALFFFNHSRAPKSKAAKCIFVILSALLAVGGVSLVLLSLGIL